MGLHKFDIFPTLQPYYRINTVPLFGRTKDASGPRKIRNNQDNFASKCGLSEKIYCSKTMIN